MGSTNRTRIFLSLLVMFVLAFSSTYTMADELYARIRGTVVDSSGAVVTGAKVVATGTLTGISKEAPSKSDGSYEFLNLAPGTYSVEATAPGFKAFKAGGIEVFANQIFVQKLTLQVGQASEVITVEANSVQVDTTSIQLGGTLTADAVVNLPLNGRNWITLQQTQPGVVSAESRFSSNYSTNGSQAQQNSYLVNGADTNDFSLNAPLVIPSPDSIGEVHIVTSTINPEFGRNSGAILNALTKSGTNQFHGTAFEFFRDTGLNAKNYITHLPAVFHQNQFGGTIGGPIWKNHTFGFFSYQGTRSRQPIAGAVASVTTFTNAERAGNFSADGALTGTSPFPLTGEDGVVHPAGTSYATLFPTGNVPLVNYNSIANNLLAKYVPLPNSGVDTFNFSPVQTLNPNQYITRIDHTFNDKNAVWFYWLNEKRTNPENLPFTGATVPGFGDTSKSSINQISGAYTHTFSATMLNEFRVGFTRNNFQTVIPQTVIQPSSLGFAITPQNTAGASVPSIAIGGNSGPQITLGFSTNGPQPRITNTRQITDNFSFIRGRHSFKFGWDGRLFNISNPFSGNNNGSYSFGGAGTYSTSNAGLDFLLGIPDGYIQQSGGSIIASAKESYAYLQDQWRVSNRLTLTYGVGWSIDTPLKQIQNGGLSVNCFTAGAQSKIYPLAPTGLLFPGDNGCDVNAGQKTYYDHFGPRFGFAWDIFGDGKNALRGGYGIYFNRSEEELALQNLGAVPFSLSSPGAVNPGFANPFQDIAGTPGNSVANPFPFTVPAKGSAVDFAQFGAMSLNIPDSKFNVPYSQNFNLNLQRELPGKMIASIGYVGSLGRRLIYTKELNPITPAGAAACLVDPACAGIDPVTGLRGSGYLRQHSNFPTHSVFPGDSFASLSAESTGATSNYNSMQVSVTKAPSHGLAFQLSYTWSHSLDENSSYEDGAFTGVRGNSPNLMQDYGNSSFDARQRFVFAPVYDIPDFGFGMIPKRITSGWRISGIVTAQSGFPIIIGDSTPRSLQCDNLVYYSCWDRPNYLGGYEKLNPRTAVIGGRNHLLFDKAVFAREPYGTLGDARRGAFPGPGLVNTDMAFSKITKITEGKSLELRTEFFNLFNHTNFNNPSGNIASSNFGRVTSAKSPRVIQLAAKINF